MWMGLDAPARPYASIYIDSASRTSLILPKIKKTYDLTITTMGKTILTFPYVMNPSFAGLWEIRGKKVNSALERFL